MRSKIAESLIDVEAQLRQLGLWQMKPPPSEALASTEPFCVDTLSLPQWLQFVFLPTLYQLLEQQLPLPERCAVTPMAEEYFRASHLATEELLMVLAKLDVLISETP
ncbi:YqcC family protein [Parahaliea sp. F7430]|uniref:YqcC family protein n=1 Tax=Sediminihaliea albiluteola TaxID=2758564 RepID=A0A7W2YJN2_9GAMM|nr:YqcC family protein [Sediminihaliea albiluteola]MBA6413242.1 YqcC family protein [Sediminihaliea albiluteola]